MPKAKRAEVLPITKEEVLTLPKKANKTEMVIPDLKQFSNDALQVLFNRNVSLKNLIELWVYREQDENKLENLILSADKYTSKNKDIEFNEFIKLYFQSDISVMQANALEAKKTKLIREYMKKNNINHEQDLDYFYEGIDSFLNTENYKFIKDDLLELCIAKNLGSKTGRSDIVSFLIESKKETRKSLLKYIRMHISKRTDFLEKEWQYNLFINEAKKTPRSLFFAREETFNSLIQWHDYGSFMKKVERISRTIADKKNEEDYYLWITKIASNNSELASKMMSEFLQGKTWYSHELQEIESSQVNRKYINESFRKDFLKYINIVTKFEKVEKFKEEFKNMFLKNYDVLSAKTIEKFAYSILSKENVDDDRYKYAILRFFNDEEFIELRSKLAKDSLEDFVGVVYKIDSPKSNIDDFARYLQNQINKDAKKTKSILSDTARTNELETISHLSIKRSLRGNSLFPNLGIDVWLDYAAFVSKHQKQIERYSISLEDSLDTIIKNASSKSKIDVKIKKFLQTLNGFDQSLNYNTLEEIFTYAKNTRGKKFDDFLNQLEEIKELSFIFSQMAHTAAGYIAQISKRRDILESAISIAEFDREKGKIFVICAANRDKNDEMHKLGTAYFFDKKLQAYQIRKLYNVIPQIENLTNLDIARTFAAVVSNAAKKSDSLTDYLLKYTASLKNNQTIRNNIQSIRNNSPNIKNNNQIIKGQMEYKLPVQLVSQLLENMKYITNNNWRLAGAYFQQGMKYIIENPSMFEIFSLRTLDSMSRMSSRDVLDLLIDEGANSNWKEHPRPGYSTRFKNNTSINT